MMLLLTTLLVKPIASSLDLRPFRELTMQSELTRLPGEVLHKVQLQVLMDPRQTADTFQAAATFLELSHIWGPLDPEIASKIKFAKYHALRIAKALKAGEDPNLSNPIPEPPSENQPPLEPNDPDVRALNGQSPSLEPTNILQPSVEEVPDEHDQLEPRLARASSLDQSLHPSRAPSLPRPPAPEYQLAPPEIPSPKELSAENFYHGPANDEVSPIAPSAAEGGMSVGGGYFPSVPNEYDAAQRPELPGPPSNNPIYFPQVQAPPASSLPPQSSSNYTPREQASFSTVFPSHPGQSSGYVQAPTPPQNPQYPPHPSTPAFGNIYQTPQVPSIVPPSHRLPPQPIKYKESFRTDEDAVMMAQKHAKWAISALNFEDVNTAVNELRAALDSLGAA